VRFYSVFTISFLLEFVVDISVNNIGANFYWKFLDCFDDHGYFLF